MTEVFVFRARGCHSSFGVWFLGGDSVLVIVCAIDWYNSALVVRSQHRFFGGNDLSVFITRELNNIYYINMRILCVCVFVCLSVCLSGWLHGCA